MICRAAAKLHNHVTESDGGDFDKGVFHGADFGVENLPNHNKGCLNTLPTSATRGMVHKDQRRRKILDRIETLQLQRPIDDVLQNHCDELDGVSVVDDTVVDDTVELNR